MKIILIIILLINFSSWARSECLSKSEFDSMMKESHGLIVFKADRIDVTGKDGFRIAQRKTTVSGTNMTVHEKLQARLRVITNIDYYTRKAIENKDIKLGEENDFKSTLGKLLSLELRELSLRGNDFVTQTIALAYFKEFSKAYLVTRDYSVRENGDLVNSDKICIEYKLENLRYVEFDKKEAAKVLTPAKKSKCSGAEDISFSCKTISELFGEMRSNGNVLTFTADSNLQSGAKFLLTVNPKISGSIYLESSGGDITLELSRIINPLIDTDALK